MANIKSAKKRILVIETKTLRNKSIKSKVKTCIKNVEVAVAKGDKEAAQAAAANVAAIAQHAAMTRLAIVRSFIADPSSVDWKVSMFDSPPTANRKIYGARLDTQEN